MKQIFVIMEGGVIHNIMGIPEGVGVVVRDYDVEGCDVMAYVEEERLFKDVAGEWHTEATWEANEEAGLPEPSTPVSVEEADVEKYR